MIEREGGRKQRVTCSWFQGTKQEKGGKEASQYLIARDCESVCVHVDASGMKRHRQKTFHVL